jgi:hypothetical protein
MTSRLNNDVLNFKLFMVIAVLLVALALSCIQFGRSMKQHEIESRVWPHQKDCYNEQDLEIIILGETQK